MGEDELIRTIFAPLASGYPGALGLEDDAAILTPAPGEDLVLTTDAVAGGVHFFADDNAADIAWKALAVNVSDLAAKAARPLAYLLAISFPSTPDPAWLDGFARGLSEAQDAFSIRLAGGDTDRRPGPVTITVTAIGSVPKGDMVRRATARAGDLLFVSGTIGDSALGLRLRRDQAAAAEMGLDWAEASELVGRYLRPRPRTALASALMAHANAAMDVSDGLVKDAGRLARASGLAAEIEAARVPMSAAASIAVDARPDLFEVVVTGGDDYEILAAVSPDRADAFTAAAEQANERVAVIGRLVSGTGVTVSALDGRQMAFDQTGWEHFPHLRRP